MIQQNYFVEPSGHSSWLLECQSFL